MNISPALIGNSAGDDIASGSYNWAPTQRPQFCWILRMLYSNVLHFAVPKSSFTWSVFRILPLYTTLQIWVQCLTDPIFLLLLVESVFKTHSLFYSIITFRIPSRRITQHPNSYCQVTFKIFEHLFAWYYDLFLKWKCLYSWFEQP
jgi:hypothetical protein